MLINFVYIKRDTPIHKLDPRLKFILLFTCSFCAAQTSNFWFILAAFIGTLIYYRLARLKWVETRRAWYLIFFIAFVLLVVNYFISGGAIVQGVDLSHPHLLWSIPFIGFQWRFPFFTLAPLTFTVESITFLLTQAMRIFGVVLLALPITYTTDPSLFGIAFRGMGISDSISYAIDLSLRFVPTTIRDFNTTLDAQRARGFEIDKLRGGIFGKVARLAPMLVPVVIGSIVGAEDIINAMELRCFGVTRRTWLIELRARQIDRLIITLALTTFALVTLLNILGFYFTTGPLHVLHVQGIPSFLLR